MNMTDMNIEIDININIDNQVVSFIVTYNF